jgi:CRISPR-associated protein Csx17
VASTGGTASGHEAPEETGVPLLLNIFGIELLRGRLSFPKARPARAVWHNGDPLRLLVEVLHRRMVDSDELDPVPLKGTQPCSLASVDQMLGGTPYDDDLMVKWVPALSLLAWGSSSHYPSRMTEKRPASGMHVLYLLFKPLFNPELMRISGKPIFPDNNVDSVRPHAGAARALLYLIMQNRIHEAIALARRRYLAAGWRTIAASPETAIDVQRLAAALLVPVEAAAIASEFGQCWVLPSRNRT